MGDAGPIRHRMEVVSCDDRHVGYVDHVMGTQIELGQVAKVEHYLIPASWVVEVDSQVHLDCTRDMAEALWEPATAH